MLATTAAAQDAASLQSELTRQEHRAADPALSITDRDAATDEAIKVRAHLIAAAGAKDSAQLQTWRIDQAAALMARLGRDGTDTSVLLGLPTSDQRRAAAQTAEEIQRLTDPVASRAAASRARALLILAALATDPAHRASQAQSARALLETLEPDTAASDAARSVNLALALLLRDAAADAAKAADRFAALIAQPAPEMDRPTRIEAWLGSVAASRGIARESATARLREQRTQEPFTIGEKPDALATVLSYEAVARTGLPGAAGFQEMLALLSRRDLGLDDRALRSLVYEKIAAAITPATPLDELPPDVAFARATALAHDRGSAAEAQRLFAAVAERADAGQLRPEAIWEAAALGLADQNPKAQTAAVEQLVALVRAYPNWLRAKEALAAAVGAGQRLESTLKHDDPAYEPARRAYLAALALATPGAAGASADRSRYERARTLLGAGASDPPTAPDASTLDTALSLLEAIAPAKSPAGGDEAEVAVAAAHLYVQVVATEIRRATDRIDESRRAGDEAAVRRIAADALEPIARRAEAWARTRGSPDLDAFRLALADAQTEQGRGDGVATYKALLAAKSGAAHVRLNLGRAQLASGDSAGAFSTLRALAQGLEPLRPLPREFWHAWSVLLGILAGQNADGSRSDTIRVQIKCLETLDPDLGGVPWRARIEQIRKDLR
jgi:hypothetical protein